MFFMNFESFPRLPMEENRVRYGQVADGKKLMLNSLNMQHAVYVYIEGNPQEKCGTIISDRLFYILHKGNWILDEWLE